jgi:colicin import membrane protein
MNVSVLPRESALMPQKADGLGAGALMAFIVHLGLILALAFGVSWHASEPEGVQAELWAAVPQIAAPTPVAPPPPPVVKEEPKPQPKVQEPPKPTQRDADIAIEKEREKQKKLQEQQEREKAEKAKAEKDKADKEKAEKEKLAKAEADKRKAKEEEQRLAKLREENLKRMMGEVAGTGAPNATGNAARDAGPSASYAGRIVARVRPNITYTDSINSLPGNPVAVVELRLAPDGTILSSRIAKSSGVKEWDEAVLRAVEKTGVLPRDIDGRVPSSMIIEFRPKT